ncbi:orotidine-5'-phosphate decarboxylase [Arcanobacterium pinnipediorum]|uniref:Orotidine 5'-phosphate decarboxylase n=1 Tax=Arcanobacterium pinnipediorum TaxID=1503041 RepID=A0ABY5AFR1_9ACTO|nr:orotidine-5'-phosphate decarboxylase [Arcanobacterium pinnipediorum]USR78778.1 orotidine-5'-phosphate decarboxylase [Arcanobacterium pinnipediorum]
MNREVIVACDFDSTSTLLSFLDQFETVKPFVKIGMEMFYAGGPQVVREVKERGHKIFLDLKLHDIPQTVRKTMRVLSNLDVDMTNVHCAGGISMMEAALEGLSRPDGSRPLLIGVTQLTSTSQETLENELLITAPMPEVVAAYAANAHSAGLDGVVCSPLEVQTVHQELGDNFLTVTPGIRFADSAADDQRRITTPDKAYELGSNMIVVGRPITQATDPVAAYNRCVKEFSR